MWYALINHINMSHMCVKEFFNLEVIDEKCLIFMKLS